MKFLKLFTRCRPRALDLLSDSSYKKELVNEKYNDLRTCTHIVAQDSDHKWLRILINYGADIWTKTVYGIYPLHLAVQQENLKIIDILLEDDIPYHVVESISISLNNEEKQRDNCIFYDAILLNNPSILKKLIDKFFLLLGDRDILKIIKESIHYLGARNTYKILEDCPPGRVLFSHIDCLLYSLRRDYNNEKSMKYLLEKGDLGYPFDVTKHCRLFQKYMHDPKCRLIRYFILYKNKVTNIADSILLTYAIAAQNPNMVNILLALGYDPKKNTSEKTRKRRRLNEENHLLHAVNKFNTSLTGRVESLKIIYSLLIHYGSYNNDKTMQIVTEFYNNVTLYEMISYHILIRDLGTMIANNIKVKI